MGDTPQHCSAESLSEFLDLQLTDAFISRAKSQGDML